MNVRHIAAVILVPMWFSASATTYFSAGPKSARFPDDLTTSNANGLLPVDNMYKHAYTPDGWTIETVDGTTYSFLAPSYSGTENAQESRLTTVPFTVETNKAWLRWNAKSVLPGFPEAYDVVVTVTGNNEPVNVASIEAEDFEWHTRILSLEQFAGKEISVTFVCRSVNKYMLALQNIFAGEFDSHEWVAYDTTPRYASVSEGMAATGSILNVGAEMENAVIMCRVGDEELSYEIGETWATGETRDYNFELPLNLNEVTSYSLGIQDNEGNFTPVVSSDVFASHFVRNLVVDEGTGMWCNNCPEGILELENLKREYGENIIELSCHVNDVFALDNYWANLQFYAVPYMMLNRNRSTSDTSSKSFTKEYTSSTLAEILLASSVSEERNEVEIEATCHFAEAFDNSDGRYRIGYTLTGDIFSPDNQNYYQQNNLTFNRGKQYYILPSLIPCTLARFDNVVLDEAFAFSGIEGSLPENIEAMADYTTSFKVTLPHLAEQAENVRVVAYVLNTETGEIMNAAASPVNNSNGIGYISDNTIDGNISVKITPDRKCIIHGLANDEKVRITVVDAAGRIFDSVEATSSALEATSLKLPEGIAIVTLRTPTQTVITKCFTH
ncbi:MAG: Omp28-related outer membrane protein [Bacteroides sp.]|nr:Omp28-related outer membrane protein [Bacteroides sp.]